MSEQEEQTQSPTLRGSDNEKPVDLSGAIPFMITIPETNHSSVINDNNDDYNDYNYISPMERNPEWQEKMSGGSWNMDTSLPTIDQVESEKNVRNILFKDMIGLVGVNNKTTIEEHPDEDDDDWFGFGMSGGTTMTPDYPSKEQQEAENEVRASLFKDLENANNWTPPKEFVYSTMLNSYMFQNTDGFTAMNDHGLSVHTKIDTRSSMEHFDVTKFTAFGTEPAENFGIAAANDEAETTVDDFFPPPFIPFTM